MRPQLGCYGWSVFVCIFVSACGNQGSSPSSPPPPDPPPSTKVCADYTGTPASELHHYEGLMHMHSSYSDGVITDVPADYYAQAKSLGYSFVGGSEHSDTLDTGVFISVGSECFETPEGLLTCLTPSADELVKWQSTANQAAAQSDDHFLAIRGFEWTSDRFGHINVYFSQNFSNAKLDGGYVLTMDTFWAWLTRDPSTPGVLGGSPSSPVPMGGGSDGLAHFNHPHDKCFDTESPECDWNDFELIPEAVDMMFGIEAYNTDQRDDRYMPYLSKALDKGWYLSFVGSEDNHSGNYGADELPKTVTVATSLTEAGFRDAWSARRTYALAPGRHLRVEFEAEGHPMGSQLDCDAGAEVPVKVAVHRTDGAPFPAVLRLFGEGGTELAQVDGSAGEFRIPVKDGKHWYFVRVDSADEEGLSAAYIAPVWITSR